MNKYEKTLNYYLDNNNKIFNFAKLCFTNIEIPHVWLRLRIYGNLRHAYVILG